MIDKIQESKTVPAPAKDPSTQTWEQLFKQIRERDQKAKAEAEASKNKQASPQNDVGDDMSRIILMSQRTYEGAPVFKIRPPVMSDETFDKLAGGDDFLIKSRLVSKFTTAAGETELTYKGIARIKAKYDLDLEPYIQEVGSNDVDKVAAEVIDRNDQCVKDNEGELILPDGVITKKDLKVIRDLNYHFKF